MTAVDINTTELSDKSLPDARTTAKADFKLMLIDILNSSSVTRCAGFRITDPGRLTVPSIFLNSVFPTSRKDITDSKDEASTGAEILFGK